MSLNALRLTEQLCSARKTPSAFCLSLLARNERGEGEFDKKCLLSPALSSFLRRRRRENAVTRSRQLFCRTQLLTEPRSAELSKNRGEFEFMLLESLLRFGFFQVVNGFAENSKRPFVIRLLHRQCDVGLVRPRSPLRSGFGRRHPPFVGHLPVL